MKIEVLFPEIANLYGDLMNVKYLEDCIPDAEIIRTSLQMKPRFTEEEVDLVYMGTTTEQGQLLALEKLMPYRDVILKRIEEGSNFLITGNAMELFGRRIEEDGKVVCQCLDVFPGIAKRSSINRFNSLFVGTFDPGKGNEPDAAKAGSGDSAGAADPITIVGFKSQFGHTFGESSDTQLDPLAMIEARRGPGMNRYAKGEGIRINNFMATYIIGPLLVLNPPFTKWLIREKLGFPIEKMAFEEAAMDCYQARVAQYEDPNTGIYYWGGTNERWT